MFSFSVLNLFSRMSGKSGASALVSLACVVDDGGSLLLGSSPGVSIDVRGRDPQVAPGHSTFSFAL